MSGPLRRTQRSRPVESGEPLPEGQAAETEGAAPKAETPPITPAATGGEPASADPSTAPPGAADTRDADEPASEPPEPGTPGTAAPGVEPTPRFGDEDTVPRAEPPPADATASQDAPTSGSRRSPWRRFRRRPKAARMPAAPAPPPAPVLLADPGTPAGVDPVEAPLRPPAGRRGRLRRRLRYLRRARELMLRDLGGLLYEVHRTGGGSVEAHATVVGAKVQRIAGLDAEAHALETALASPRGETIVFEPGVGGACASCGELYGSDARFCANCGAPLDGSAPVALVTGAEAAVSGEEVAAKPERRAFWRRAAPAEASGLRDLEQSEAPSAESRPSRARSPPTRPRSSRPTTHRLRSSSRTHRRRAGRGRDPRGACAGHEASPARQAPQAPHQAARRTC